MTTILLIRHGENNWVKEHRLAGWTPGVHLNENGHQQAKDLAVRLAHLPVKAVYSSPLVRCWETAEHVAAPHQLDLIRLDGMGEVKYGEWEGEAIKTLAKLPEWHTIQFAPSRFQFPGGESLRGVQARAVDTLEQLVSEHEDETIVVASHADVIKLVLAHYLGVHIDLFQRIGLSPASVSVLALSQKGHVRVMRVNDDGPLKAPPEKKQDDVTAVPESESESAASDTSNGQIKQL